MKKIFYTLLLSAQMVVIGTSCTDYLSVPVEAAKDTEEIFGDYYNFQGFVDQLYMYVADPIVNTVCMDNCYGGETIGTTNWSTGYNSVRGLYNQYLTRGYLSTVDDYGPGIWAGWKAIRIANLGLENFDLMKGTEEEKNKIKGQLLFMRAFFHQEILAAWGSIPYVDKVLTDDSEQFKLPRFGEYTAKDGNTYYGYQACAVRVAEDMQEASELLPIVWDNDVANRGRCTALAALAYKARALVFAASPLMSEYSGTSLSDLKPAEVNTGLMKQAAEAASAAIKMAKDNGDAYGLLPWSNYSDMFYTVDGSTVPWSKETLWGRYNTLKGNTLILNTLGRIHLPDNSVFGGNAINCTPTQNYVDLFEMDNGELYDKSLDGKFDENGKLYMWERRDPRFKKAIYVDRDNPGDTEETILQLYIGGKTRNADNCQTPYFIHKYWPRDCNKTDNGTYYNNMRMMVPLMRLAEVYLLYAEAVYQALGDANQKIGDCGMSALDAVNEIRSRAGQVETDDHGGAHGDFMKLILNERAVEFCFEGQYWYDIRRYKLGEHLRGEAIQTLDFTKDWTNFTRRTLVNRTFEAPKHYWMPFPTNLTKMYPEFPQNTGWE